jgi:hypothetical protein
MPTRETAVSKTVEYETEPCVHCNTEVVIEDIDVETEDSEGSVMLMGDAVEVDEMAGRGVVEGNELGIRVVCDECSRAEYDWPTDTYVAVYNTRYDVGAVHRWPLRTFLVVLTVVWFSAVIVMSIAMLTAF